MEDWPTLGQALNKSVVNGVGKVNGAPPAPGTIERAASHDDSDESQSSIQNHERPKKGTNLNAIFINLVC